MILIKNYRILKNVVQVKKLGPFLAENTEILQADFPISTVQFFIAFDDSLKD